MERRLGRGLGSLLGGGSTESVQGEGLGSVAKVALIEIRPNGSQPRKAFDPEGLQELRDSIRKHGVLQPVVLRRVSEGYELIAGERRWRAARLAGLDEIPAVVRPNVADGDMLELALVENVQRRDLNALEKALGYKQMVDQLSLTQEEVAAKVGLKRATIANHIRLLDLPISVQEGVAEGLISMGHARALLGVEGDAERISLMESIVRDGLSVRQVESVVQSKRPGADSGQGVRPEPGESNENREADQEEPWVTDLQRRMQMHLGTKVSLLNREGYKGRIVLEYYGREDLDRLVEILAPREEL